MVLGVTVGEGVCGLCGSVIVTRCVDVILCGAVAVAGCVGEMGL